MNLINFLPEHHVQQVIQRRRRYRYVVLQTVLAVCLVGWGVVERDQNRGLQQYADALQVEESAARDQMSEIVKLRSEHKNLKNQVALQQELNQPVSHTQILATLGDLLPKVVALTDLQIITKRPPPKPLEDPTAKHRRKKSKKNELTKRINDQIEIQLDAIAPDDLAVVQLIGDLSDHPLFDQVAMQFSRTTEVRGVEARQFRLSVRIRFDRRFKTREVALAD